MKTQEEIIIILRDLADNWNPELLLWATKGGLALVEAETLELVEAFCGVGTLEIHGKPELDDNWEGE